MKFRKLLWLAAVLAGSVGTAQALPVVWEDVYDPADFKLSAPAQHTFTLDLTSDGYKPGTDSIWGAALTILLYDDGDIFSPEYVKFNFDGSNWGTGEVDGVSWWQDAFTFFPTTLVSDGYLIVNVQATEGDFYFGSASLSAVGNSGTAVPEPATLALLGLGMLGIGFAARRRRT